MDSETMGKAKKEAERFLAKVRDVGVQRWKSGKRSGVFFMTGCIETGALRRCSMDLTRALADLRR